MTTFQRFFLAIMPRRIDQAMEKDSRLWKLRCLTCRSEISIWDAGGIRYRAAGRSWTLRRCRACGRITCHDVYKKN
jgi:hypothetical protein